VHSNFSDIEKSFILFFLASFHLYNTWGYRGLCDLARARAEIYP